MVWVVGGSPGGDGLRGPRRLNSFEQLNQLQAGAAGRSSRQAAENLIHALTPSKPEDKPEENVQRALFPVMRGSF